MPDETVDKLSTEKKTDNTFMQADIIDQINTNQQSNLTLSTVSVINQSNSAVYINFAKGNKEERE